MLNILRSSRTARRGHAIAACLLFGHIAQANATTFNVRAYGALGDGVHNDAPAIQKAIDVAIKDGGKDVVYIPAGNYNLDATETTDSQLNIMRSNNISVMGTAGTTLINPLPNRAFFWVWLNQNLSISNLKMLYSARMFTQITVKSISTKNNSLDVVVMDGYDDLDSRWIKAADQLLVFSDPNSGQWGDHSAACGYYAPNNPTVCWPPAVMRRERISGNTWRLYLNTAPLTNYAGKTAVLWNQQGNTDAIHLALNTNFTASNIMYYPRGTNGLWDARYNVGRFLFDDVVLTTPPGSKDLVSGYSGSWSMDNHWDLDIENSSFTRVWDEAFNTGALFERIVSTESPTVIDVEKQYYAFAPGDTVAVWDWTYGHQKERARAKVVSLDCGPTTTDAFCRLTLDRPVKVVRTGTLNTSIPTDQDGIDRIISINAAGTLHVNRSTFQTLHADALNNKAQNAVIENSTFIDTAAPSIVAGADFFFSEGPSVDTLTIRNNKFQNGGGSNIVIASERAGSPADASLIDSKNVTISGNNFQQFGRYDRGIDGDTRYPIWLQYTDGVKVSGNVWKPYNSQYAGYPSTHQMNSSNVTVSDGSGLKGGPVHVPND